MVTFPATVCNRMARFQPRRSRLASATARGCRRWRLTVLVSVLALMLAGPVPGQELIGHRDLPISELTKTEVRMIFTMRLPRLADNTPVRVFVLPDDHPLHQRFAKVLLGLFPYQLRQVWDRQLYSGTGQAPTPVASESDMIRRVAATPGALGYVATMPDHPGLRRLRVR